MEKPKMTRYAPTASLPQKSLFAAFKTSIAIAVIATISVTTSATTTAQAQQRHAQPQLQAQARQIQTLAVVNGQEITRQQIADECMRRFGSETLKTIINKHLVVVELQRAGLQVTEQDIDQEIENRGKPHGMSGERYTQTICKGRNLTLDEFRNNFIWNELALRRLAAQNINVTPEELNKRMDFEFGPRVQIRQIVLDSMQQAQKIQAQAAANPANFERLAKEFSVDQVSRPMGGLIMHAVRRNGGFPELENMVFSLSKGEVSSVLPVADKFVIFKCERVLPAEKIADQQLSAMHDRLIEQISNEKLNSEAAKMFKRLEQETKIVNVLNDPNLRKQMPGVAAVVNGQKVLLNQVAEACITRYGAGMLDTEINRTILLQSLKRAGMAVAENDLTDEIYRAAKANGFLRKDQTVDDAAWLKHVTNNTPDKEVFYIEDEVWPTVALKKLVSSSVQVTREDLQKSFEANFGPRVEVLWIETNEHRKATKIWNMAKANSTRDYFGELAHAYSIDPASMNNYGVVPPIRKHGGRPKLEQEAFSLKKGEISGLIQLRDSWVILLCLGRTEPVVADLDAVRDDLAEDILEKKMRIAMTRRFQSIRDNAQIDNFLKGTSQPGRAAIEANRETQTRRR
jgi:parvulin-like peptidyl-prolyl isomerase